MEAKQWFEKSKYVYDLDEHDEGGYLGIDENKVAEMLNDYYQYKLKSSGIADIIESEKFIKDLETAIEDGNEVGITAEGGFNYYCEDTALREVLKVINNHLL